MEIISHLYRQRVFSRGAFGPGERTKGICDHIRKELAEVENSTGLARLDEWIDVVILGLDGALRTGASPELVVERWMAKQEKNENRVWPDWRKFTEDHAIEHDRTKDTGQ